MSRKKPHKPRVFCIGWHKTGTSTMGIALLELGYTVLGARLDMAASLLEDDKSKALEEAGKFDALQDVPWAALFKELDEKYPGSKFVLTIRKEESWLNSAAKHFKDIDIPLHEWLYGNGVLLGNEELYLDRYRQHYREVREYFQNRPDDLLIMDFTKGDDWKVLCTFLKEPIPNKTFPHANKGKHNYDWKDKLIAASRRAVPTPLRKARVALLEKLGLHHGRNRFNNYYQHQELRRKPKIMTWEESIIMIRGKAKYADLVKNAYFESDLVLNIERYYGGRDMEIKNWLSSLGISSGRILDIGSGNGVSAISFALDGFQVDAVEPDPSETIGAGAIRKLKDHYQLQNLSVYESYAEDIGFSANSYDLVFTRQALHHANDLNKFVQESYRVLKPGGFMITVRDHVVFNAKDKEWFLESHPLHKFYGGENAYHPEEYEGAFTKAGFTIEKKYKFFDSPVNYFPRRKEDFNPKTKIEKLKIILGLNTLQ